MAKKNEELGKIDGVGLDVHGSEPISHQFTIFDDDGNADIEFNFSLPLTSKRHEQLVHLLEEGYSEHEAYILLAGGEILSHIEAIKKPTAAPSPRLTRPARFEEGRPMLLAGLRRHHGFAEAATTVPDQWRRFEQLGKIPGQVGVTAYGAMCGADPEKQTFEYLVGVEVATFEGLPPDLGRMRVPAARYAVFTHEGPVASIGATWNIALNEWLPKSGFESAHTPDFERYDERFDVSTASGIVEIWLGVVPAA